MKLTSILAGSLALLSLTSCNGNCHSDNSAATQVDTAAIVIDNIMARRSIRQYTNQPVEREKLDKIVECGINAPSGMNSQPWIVRVVTDSAFINGTTEIYRRENAERVAADSTFKNMYRNATALICIASPLNGSGQLEAGLLGENMMLAAQALGLGSCCLGGPVNFLKENTEACQYLAKLDIPADYQLLYIIGVGYPAEKPEARPRDASKVKFIN